MDLLDYLRIFRRRWVLLLACVAVAAVAALVTTPDEPANDTVTYTATHQLLRDSSAVAPQAMSTVALFIKTADVPERVAEQLGYRGNPAVLAASVVVEADEQVGTLEITVPGNSRAEAADRANVFAEETLAYLGEQATSQQQAQIVRATEELARLEADIDALDDEINAAEIAGESTLLLEAERDSKVRAYGAALEQQQRVVDQPPPSAGYITLQPALPELASVAGGGFSAPRSAAGRTAIAALVGLVLGLAAALLVERLDSRMHDVHAIGTAFGLPVVAEVPLVPTRRREKVLVREPMSALAESFRTLRSSLLLSPVTRLGLDANKVPKVGEPEVVLVTSSAPSDGKTTVTANLAVALAESGRTVLVLGCDFRRPEIHEYFERPLSPGIADMLTDDQHLTLSDVVVSTDHPGVFLAPSGARLRNFGDVASAGRAMVAEARKLADVVVIDTPPALATNDASELIPSADAVVVVARLGKTTDDGARRTRFLLDRLSASVAGVVAIGVPEHAAAYGGYSSYYTTPNRTRGRRRARRAEVRSEVVLPPPGQPEPLEPSTTPLPLVERESGSRG